MDFKCMDCEYEFNEPERSREHLDEHYYQDLYVCPNCGSENYIESHRCPICDEFCFTEDEWGICEDCEEIIRNGIVKILKELDPKDRNEALNQIIEVIDKL